MLKGQIIKGIGGLYFVSVNDTIYKCSVRGIFRKNKIVPTIGDYVEINILNEKNKEGYIEKINKRTNILIRPKVANVNCCVIVFSILSPAINFDLLNRFLVLAESQNIKDIVICINKCDLVHSNFIEKVKNIYKNYYKLFFISTINNQNIEELKNFLNQKTTVFAGPSGVGKSSLINKIIPNINLKTNDISIKIERGKHTTRQVELLKAWEKTYIVDSPGFTSLSLNFLNAFELKKYFKELRCFKEKCKFQDCNHVYEPNCNIKNNIGNIISKERYNNYVKLFEEISKERKSYD